MAGAPIPCDQCGNPILDSELESGTALRLRGRSFCAGCKTEAVNSFSLEDLASPLPPASPGPKASKAPVPPVRPAPPGPAKSKAPAPPPAPPRPEHRAGRIPSPGVAGNRRLPLLGGLAASGIAAVLAIVLLASGKNSPPSSPPPQAPRSPQVPPATRSPADLLKEAESLSARNDLSPEDLLSKLQGLLPLLKGSAEERKVASLVDQVRRDAEAARASRELGPKIAAARSEARADTDFARFPELRDRFQGLRDQAAASAPALLPEIQKAQADYANRYEKAAEPAYQEIQEAASVLADERRYPDALKRIESFPAKFRHSRAWAALQQLKADIDRRAKALPSK